MNFSRIFSSGRKRRNADSLIRELSRIGNLPDAAGGIAHVFNKPFRFHHASGFLSTFRKYFTDETLKFQPESKQGGIILDGGSNMGLSVLYFSLNYPNHHVIAFEPERQVFDILQENVAVFGLKNVELHQKALWVEEKELLFHSDGGMGGRVSYPFFNSDNAIQKVSGIALGDFLNTRVELLKLDIEGAENEVLTACRGKLSQVSHIYFEYHNHVKKGQSLHQLLELMGEEGFRYHIRESFVQQKPFLDNFLLCESFDMALSIFCAKFASPS